MLQEMIVYAIGIIVALYLFIKLYKTFTTKEGDRKSSCSNCSCSSSNGVKYRYPPKGKKA